MFRQLSVIPPSLLLTFSIALLFLSSSSSAQEQILNDRWIEVRSDNFHIYSQQSTRQANRFADELEVWRQVASFTISGIDSFPKASIPNLVYLFDDVETLQTFVATDEAAGAKILALYDNVYQPSSNKVRIIDSSTILRDSSPGIGIFAPGSRRAQN